MPRQSLRALIDTVVPRCPRGHAGEVVLWGHYGVRRRQRYRCRPADPQLAPHTFGAAPMARPLPHPPTVSCGKCTRDYRLHDTPWAPWRHGYAIPEIAEALVRVAAGESYCSVSAYIHRTTHAVRRKPYAKTRTPVDEVEWSLIADWVETCAPRLYDELMGQQEVDGATLLMDEVPFKVRSFGQARATLKFKIFAVTAYRRPLSLPLRLVALKTLHPFANPLGVLGPLAGIPERIVSDDDSAIGWAVKQLWPKTRHDLCVWHMEQRVTEILKANNLLGRPVHAGLAAAFQSTAGWLLWSAAATGYNITLDDWIRAHDAKIRVQLSDPKWPNSTGPLETLLTRVRRDIAYRKTGFHNQERTDRLLQLMMLNHNGLANLEDFTRILTDFLVVKPDRGRLPERHVVYAGPHF